MKLYKVKTRLLFSIAIGLIAVLLYILIEGIKPFKLMGVSNILYALWITFRIIETFLFFSALSLTITSIFVLYTKHKSRTVNISITLGLIVILIITVPEVYIRQRNNLIKKSEDKTLDTTQVIKVYKKAINRNNKRAIATIAVHPNLPDSIQENLSDSKILEVRRSIAWDTKSQKILKKLSTDKNWEVRQGVAGNKLTPKEIMDKLMNDANEYVRDMANNTVQQNE